MGRPILSSAPPREGGEDPPCVLASRRWGPTYMYSLLYTHTLGSWVDFFMKFYSRQCVGEISDHLDWLKKLPALPSAALHNLLLDYGIVFAPRRDTTAVAPGGEHSLYSCIIPSGWPIWGRRFQHCLYLVGPPEDSLRLWLQRSLVPGRTHPCSGGGHRSHCPSLGRHLHRGVVVVLIAQLEWGSSSSSNTSPF